MAKAKTPKKADSSKKGNAKDAEKAAKKAARAEKLKNRPEGQRTNSKQIDVIDLPNGGKVLTYGATVRKTGVLVTSIVIDAKGNLVSGPALSVVTGVKVKSKKGHGYLQPGLGGVGKKGKKALEDYDEEEPEEEDEDEDEE